MSLMDGSETMKFYFKMIILLHVGCLDLYCEVLSSQFACCFSFYFGSSLDSL